MTKTEIKKHINKSVYQFVESLGYMISDDGDGGRVLFYNPEFENWDDAIEYHRSSHYADVFSYAEDTVKLDAAKINEYVKAVKADIEWKLAIENGDVE
jgi:hypothetical protein